MAKLTCCRFLAGQQLLPGKECRLAREPLLDGIRGHTHGPLHGIQREFALLNAGEPEPERGREAAQALVAGEDIDNRRGLSETLRELLHFRCRAEQKTVAGEELVAGQILYGLEQVP